MGFGNTIAERKAIEASYEDICTVYRMVPITTNNITKSEPQAIYTNVVCALSQVQLKRSDQTTAQNVIDYDAKIFMPPELQVLPGDEIIVIRFGRDNPASTIAIKYESAGRPMVYPTHQEVMVRERGIA